MVGVGRYIGELVEGSRVDGVFVVRSREMRATRAGEAYLVFELADRSGSIRAVLFRPDRRASTIPSGAVVRGTGTVTSFRGLKRISLDGIAAADAWDPGDLLESGRRPREEAVADMKALVASIGSSCLKRLLRGVFSDKALFDRFCACPGGNEGGHAYIGGLLEHTVSVASACADLADRYPGVDRDLLVTAALLHDIGVVDQLTFDAGIALTDRGRMLGPGLLGVLRIHEAASRARVEDTIFTRLEHAILATADSASAAMTLEALLLTRADDLDRSASAYVAGVAAAALVEERWSNTGGTALYAPSAA